jgi:hypothetical protein
MVWEISHIHNFKGNFSPSPAVYQVETSHEESSVQTPDERSTPVPILNSTRDSSVGHNSSAISQGKHLGPYICAFPSNVSRICSVGQFIFGCWVFVGYVFFFKLKLADPSFPGVLVAYEYMQFYLFFCLFLDK